MNAFCNPIVEELNVYLNKGICCKIMGENRIIKLFAIWCCVDCVARAPLQGLTQFNGFYGCNWCLYPGESISGTVKYTLQHQELQERNNLEHIQNMQFVCDNDKSIKGVKSVSYLINLFQFDMVSGFVPDYIHCTLLGVARQFAEI